MVLVNINRNTSFYRLIMLLILVITMFEAKAEKYKFYFGDGNKEGYQTVNTATLYSSDSSYG